MLYKSLRRACTEIYHYRLTFFWNATIIIGQINLSFFLVKYFVSKLLSVDDNNLRFQFVKFKTNLTAAKEELRENLPRLKTASHPHQSTWKVRELSRCTQKN